MNKEIKDAFEQIDIENEHISNLEEELFRIRRKIEERKAKRDNYIDFLRRNGVNYEDEED